MKILVDRLPYYYDMCPFGEDCWDHDSEDCPRRWDKYKVCSDDNPHECALLKEVRGEEE